MAGLLAACSNTPDVVQAEVRAPSIYTNTDSGPYETGKMLRASDFIPAHLISGPYHSVDPQVRNDGFANIYTIRTDDYVYIAEGTAKALQRIEEIEAVERSKKDSTVEVVGGTVAGKVKTLVDTPVRLVKSGTKRVKKVGSTKDALLLVPRSAGDIMVDVGGGVYEISKTGVGVAKQGIETVDGDSEEDCSGAACVSASGKAAKKGFDELSGAAAKARRRHQQLGTDPYSDNPVLQKEIRRIAYSKTFSGIGFSAGLTAAGLPPAVNAYRSGVTLYNRSERLIEYSDPYERRDIEQAKLASWGVPKKQIDRFYQGEVFTPTIRTRLILALETIPHTHDRSLLFERALNADTGYLARGDIKSIRYLGELQAAKPGGQIVTDIPMMGFRDVGGDLIVVFHADYLTWTPEIERALSRMQSNPKIKRLRSSEFHLLGRASPRAQTEINRAFMTFVAIQ